MRMFLLNLKWAYHRQVLCRLGKHWMKFGPRGCVYCGKPLKGRDD